MSFPFAFRWLRAVQGRYRLEHRDDAEWLIVEVERALGGLAFRALPLPPTANRLQAMREAFCVACAELAETLRRS